MFTDPKHRLDDIKHWKQIDDSDDEDVYDEVLERVLKSLEKHNKFHAQFKKLADMPAQMKKNWCCFLLKINITASTNVATGQETAMTLR